MKKEKITFLNVIITLLLKSKRNITSRQLLESII